MILNAKRLYLVLSGLIVLALIVLGVSVYMATGVLQKKSEDVRAARLETLVLEEKQTKLTKAKADIEKYDELAQIARSIVPQDKDQARTVREISNLATANGIKLGSITFPSSSLGTVAPKKGAVDSQLQAVKGMTGTYIMNISIRSDPKASPKFTDFVKFLEALEQNRRTALVSGITLVPDTKNPNILQFSLTLDEYIKP